MLDIIQADALPAGGQQRVAAHSPAFHAAHKRIYGADPRPAREWLRAHGAGLHRYRA